ncbi:MAG: DUF2163 domain-containing protein [Roseinatronobacter sp.]
MTLQSHLATGTTTIARAFALTRRDGIILGFTDHDRDLTFDGITFTAATGLDAGAVEQMTGLAVDNAEVAGALSAASLSETDILAGRYDGAQVTIWRVNWAVPDQREILFRGTIGEITQSGGAFKAELRGLSEALNQTGGRVFHASCAAVLGDSACGVNIGAPGRSVLGGVVAVNGAEIVLNMGGQATGYFTHGEVTVLTGAAKGLIAMVREDRALPPAQHLVTLWSAFTIPLAPGDLLRVRAGCDKRAETCRVKFNNFLNFRGFPHIPGEDWLTAYPRSDQPNTGGRRR